MQQNRTGWLTRSRALRSLEHRDWRKLWFVSQLWHLPFWMDYIILGWVVLERTDSPFLVALVGAFRLLPMGTLGFFRGESGRPLAPEADADGYAVPELCAIGGGWVSHCSWTCWNCGRFTLEHSW